MIGNLIAWAVAILVIALMIRGLVRDNDRKKRRSAEEFERDVASRENFGNALVSASGLTLQKLTGSHNEAAIEFKLDEKGGMTKTASQADDADRTDDRGVL